MNGDARDPVAAARLEEYKVLQSQVDNYLRQRNNMLTIAVTSLGALLGFGGNRLGILVAALAILAGAAALTWEFTAQAVRRATYILVFLEQAEPGLRWFTALRQEQPPPSKGKLAKARLQSYPTMYVALALAATVYMVAQTPGLDRALTTWVGLAGILLILAIAVRIHRANSDATWNAWVDEWKRVSGQLEGG